MFSKLSLSSVDANDMKVLVAWLSPNRYDFTVKLHTRVWNISCFNNEA